MDRDQQRDYQARLRKLRIYEGVTCSLELAFNHNTTPLRVRTATRLVRGIPGRGRRDRKRPGRGRYRTKATRLAGITPRIESGGALGAARARRRRLSPLCPPPCRWAPAAAKVLVHRGFADPAAARRFLHPTFEELHDPLTLRDMPAAIERIARAIREREQILIYGDYDVDGTTSVVLLTKAFELAGGIATYHVPHRLKDGYGMRPEVVEAAAEQGVKLIVSVDTGIRAAEVVRRANELGIDVIVTDHHLPETRPAARAGRAQSQSPGLPVPGEEPVRRGRGLQADPGAVAVDGLAGGEGAARFGIVPQAGGDRHGGRRGSAHRRESHHRQPRSARPATRCATWTARPAGCGGLHGWRGAQRTPGGASRSRRASMPPDAWTPPVR